VAVYEQNPHFAAKDSTMSRFDFLPARRAFLGTAALSAAYFTTRGLFAEELARTPAQTEGPFYPDKLPLDTDNDLLVLNDSITPAVGEVTHLTGRVLDTGGSRSPTRCELPRTFTSRCAKGARTS
jgi:hypothetical protein